MLGDEAAPGDLLDLQRAGIVAQQIDELALLRGQVLHPLLVVGGQLVQQAEEGFDQILEGLQGQEAGEHHIDPVVAARELMHRPDAGSPLRGDDEVGQRLVAGAAGDPLQQFHRLAQVQLLEVLDAEEPVER